LVHSLGDDVREAGLDDRQVPLLEAGDAIGVDVSARDVVTEVGETCPRRQPDVPATDDRDRATHTLAPHLHGKGQSLWNVGLKLC
jgi:hypothetical protein